jgi:endonuclease/exonuclease/phosphatase family metal-dependent hydrolase
MLVLACSLVPPDRLWLAGFIAYGIPIFLFSNLVLLVWKIFKKQISALYPFIILILGYGFIRDAFQISRSDPNGNIKVISFNVRVFNVYFENDKDVSSVHEMIKWINDQKADIMCFQEFYNDAKSSTFNTIKKISRANNYHYFHSPKYVNRIGAEFGDVIFSKYPIINEGQILFEKNSLNKVIYIDLKIDTDTIRVYNMHLQSLHIIEDELINSKDLQSGVEHLVANLKNGFIQRTGQIRMLLDDIQKCTYPIILCGDLNDLPYSYAYRKLKNTLRNGFSESGNGFGFTYNGKLFFLRIDNHFFSEELEVHTFTTHREMKCSDHFPVSATYSINR